VPTSAQCRLCRPPDYADLFGNFEVSGVGGLKLSA